MLQLLTDYVPGTAEALVVHVKQDVDPKAAPMRKEMVAAPLMNAWMEESRAGARETPGCAFAHADGRWDTQRRQVTLSFLTKGIFPQIC